MRSLCCPQTRTQFINLCPQSRTSSNEDSGVIRRTTNLDWITIIQQSKISQMANYRSCSTLYLSWNLWPLIKNPCSCSECLSVNFCMLRMYAYNLLSLKFSRGIHTLIVQWVGESYNEWGNHTMSGGIIQWVGESYNEWGNHTLSGGTIQWVGEPYNK